VEPGCDDYAAVPLRRRRDIAVKLLHRRALPEPTLNGYTPTVSPFVVAVSPLALPVAVARHAIGAELRRRRASRRRGPSARVLHPCVSLRSMST